MDSKAIIYIFLGGGFGSVLRYAISSIPFPISFPFSTLVANSIACGLVGILAASYQQQLLSDQQRWLLIVGFCGGFSTFSTFSYEVVEMWRNQKIWKSVGYIFISNIVCISCTGLGLLIGSKYLIK